MQHPVPVHALENSGGQLVYFGVVKISAAGQHATKKNGGVYGRDFGLEDAFAILNVEEMRVKAVLVLHPGGHETQGVANAVANFSALLPAALVGNAMGGKAEAGGGDAGGVALVGAVGVAAVFYQASDGIGFVPEKLEAGAFEIFEEFVFVASEAIFCGIVFEEWGALGSLRRGGPGRVARSAESAPLPASGIPAARCEAWRSKARREMRARLIERTDSGPVADALARA